MTYFEKTFLGISGILIAISIALGALGAHALKKILTTSELSSFKTGVLYLTIHGLAIIIVTLTGKTFNIDYKNAIRCITIGSILFSFSIFLLLTFKHLNIYFLNIILGPTTPLGGVLMIIGWILFSIKTIKSSQNI